MTLAIESIKSDFLSNAQHHHIVVSAATGTGKSTQLPIWSNTFGKVLVIEPRRIACISLAEHVACLCQSELGKKVGYAIRFEVKAHPQTDIMFVTPGVALRWLFEGKHHEYDTIIIDEFHERRWDTDLILALLKQQQFKRLIVTSATLQSNTIANYLDAKILHAVGKQYDIESFYVASHARQMPDKSQLDDRIKSACEKALAIANKNTLIFVPGKAQMRQCAAKLRSLDVDVIELHGGSSIAVQKKAFSPTPHRRVIIATNVAETSLTLPDIDCVIDSGLENRTHIRNGRSVLGLSPISLDSKRQRMGRAGRTMNGFFIALYGEYAPLEAHTPPEIQRENLVEMTLAAASTETPMSTLSFIDSVDSKAYHRALGFLQKINAIDHNEKATDYGKALYPLPIDIDLAHLIAQMPNGFLQQAMCDLAAMIAVPNKIFTIKSDIETIDALEKRFPDACDMELAIAVLRNQARDLVDYEPSALDEAIQFANHLRSAFHLPQLNQPANYQKHALVDAIAAINPSLVYINKENRRGGFGNGDHEVQIGRESLVAERHQAIVVLNTYSLAGKGTKDAKTLATMSSPLSHQKISELGLSQNALIDANINEDNEIIGIYEQSYANKVFKTTAMALQSIDLNRAVVMLMKKEQLFAGTYQQLLAQYQWSELYCQIKQIQFDEMAPDDKIRQMLSDLEIDSLEELALFDGSDFHYHVIPDYEKADFYERFPLEINLPQLALRVEYQLSAKSLTLHYLKGQRKEAPKRWELPTFSGLRINYKKASKRVVIK